MFQFLQARLRRGDFLVGQFTQVGVGAHAFGGGQVGLGTGFLGERGSDRFKLGEFARKVAETGVVGDHIGFGEQAFQFFAALGQRFQLRRRVGVIGSHGWVAVTRRGREQALGGAGQVGIATERGRAQSGGRRMQQAVGQAMGQQFQHFVGGLAVGQLLPCALQQFGAGRFAERTQLPQRCLVGAGLLGLDETRHLQVDDRLGLGGGLAAATTVVFHRAFQVIDGRGRRR